MNRYKLKDLSLNKLEYGSGAAACDYDGNTRYVRITDIDNDGDLGSDIVSPNIVDEKYLLMDGDILFARTGATVGKTYLYQSKAGRCIYAGFLIRVVPNQELIRPCYLYYFTKSPQYKGFVQQSMKVVAQPNINAKQYGDLEINVPSLEIQDKIIKKLQLISEIITLRKKELQKMEDLIKSRFVEMFGNYPMNEMGWNIGTIRDIVKEVRYGSSRPAVDGGQYPYLRMNNITYGGELDLTDIKRIDIPDNELDKCTVRRGDVLFNRTNSKELVGKTCVYNRDELMVLAGFVIRVRVNERILPEFLSAFLNADFSKQMLLGLCKTAIGQANINAQEMQNIGLYLPPIEIQQQFVNFKIQVDKSKVAVQQALDKAQLLFDSLMQQYFG